MVKAAPIAALIVVACLAAARGPSHPCRSPRRAGGTLCAVRLASARPPEFAHAATAPVETPCAPDPSASSAFVALVSITQVPTEDVRPLLAALVSLSRRLLQGDLALAQATLAKIDSAASPSGLRNMCLVLLGFTEAPRAREALRAKALSADDDAASLALETVVEARTLRADSPDDSLEGFWLDMLVNHEAALLPAGWEGYTRAYEVWYSRRNISLAPPAEGEEEGGGATIEEQADIVDQPPLDGARRDVLVAVAQAGASLATRVKAITWLGMAHSVRDILWALARAEGTPNEVKSAVLHHVDIGVDDYEFIKREIQVSHDPRYLATLCDLLIRCASTHRAEAIAILEGLAPLADTDGTLANDLMSAMSCEYSIPVVEAIERIARSAESEHLRHAAVFALHDGWNRTDPFECHLERMDTLQRLSWAPCAALAAEASHALLWWMDSEPAWAPLMTDDAFLQRAGALAQMPSVPTPLREQLSLALARRTKPSR